MKSLNERERKFSGDGVMHVLELGSLAMRRSTCWRVGLADTPESSLLGGSKSVRFTRRRPGDTTPRGVTWPMWGSSSDEGWLGVCFEGDASIIESSIGQGTRELQSIMPIRRHTYHYQRPSPPVMPVMVMTATG